MYAPSKKAIFLMKLISLNRDTCIHTIGEAPIKSGMLIHSLNNRHHIRSSQFYISTRLRVYATPITKPAFPLFFFHMSPLTLSRRQILHFYHQGYIHLPGLVPPDLLSPARSLIDTSYSLHQYRRSGSNRLGSSLRIPVFDLSVKLAPQLLALVHETGLLNLADSLLGKGNAAVREGKAQVAYMETNEHFVRDGMNDHEPHPKLGWHVDSGIGLYAALCSGFSLLVGVAVSEGQELDVNRGQFTIWPGM